MAVTFHTYNGDGTTTDFAIPFQYLDKTDIVVTRLLGSVTFSFVNPSLIQLSAPLAIGDKVTIERQTNVDAPAVLWKNGSGTTGTQLNRMMYQMLYAMQEAKDTAARGLFRLASGVYDFAGSRATNVGYPILAGDAASKAYVDIAAPTAQAQANLAQTAAGQAHDYSDVAKAARDEAVAAAAQAVGVAGVTAAGIPVTPAGNISSTTVQTALQELDSEKAALSHTHIIANVTGLQTALDNKLDDSQATATGLALLGAATADAARAVIGVGWRELADVKLTGTEANHVVAIPSDVDIVHIEGLAFHDASGFIGYQYSNNGGTSWKTANSDYYIGYEYQMGVEEAGAASEAVNVFRLTGPHDVLPVAVLFSATLYPGAASKVPVHLARGGALVGDVGNGNILSSGSGTAGRVTHIRFLSSPGNLTAGTRIIVEGR